jgi:uncharacterized membrane protein
MAHDPVHLFVGLYDGVALAERDLEALKRLHAEGLTGAYDAAVVARDDDGRPRVVERKHSHGAWIGAGVGAIIGVIYPIALVPLVLGGAAAGVLVRHAQQSLSKKDAVELAEALDGGEAALCVIGDVTMGARLEQVLPGATRRLARVLDVEKDDFSQALQEANSGDDRSSST